MTTQYQNLAGDGAESLAPIATALRSAWQMATSLNGKAHDITRSKAAHFSAVRGDSSDVSHHRLLELLGGLPGARVQNVRPGKRILNSAESPTVVFVEQGALALSLARQRGETILLLVYGSGRFCAPPELDEDSTPISLTTLLPSRIVEVPRDLLLDAALVRPELMTVIVRLERNLHSLLNRMVALLERLPERRLAATLQYLARELDDRCPITGGARITLSQDAIGAAAGLARQTTNRLLQRFCRAGVLTIETRLLCLLDAPRLHRIASGLETIAANSAASSLPLRPGS